jgi:hypothetical protein
VAGTHEGALKAWEHRPRAKQKPASSERAARALSTYKPSSKDKQDRATAAERLVAKMLRAKPTGDNQPVDVVFEISGRMHGVEIKSISDNGNNKITMHPESLRRKISWGHSNHATLHTVVVDTRTNTIYYRHGVGSFRLHTLTKVNSAAHLRQLMGFK